MGIAMGRKGGGGGGDCGLGLEIWDGGVKAEGRGD